MVENNLINGVVITETTSLTLDELSHAIHAKREVIIEMIEHEVFQPIGEAPEEWRFDSYSLKRAKTAISFYDDLGINFPGIALALDLLNQIDLLEHELKRYHKS